MRISKLLLFAVILGFTIAIAYSFYTKVSAAPPLQASTTRIAINQVGYYPKAPKIALLLDPIASGSNKVELVNSRTRKTVLVADLGEAQADTASKDIIRTIDFTQFQQAGRYYLKYGNIQSYPFRIGRDIYGDALTKLLHSYYLQRCGVAVSDRVSGVNHPPCHLSDGLIARRDFFNQVGEQKRAQGGWHDAGDYGKYIGPTAVTVGRLLNLYEQNPTLFKNLQLAIPENRNRRPDILDETKVGLDWMLTMQRADGAVYRKLSGKEWPGSILPNEDKQPRYIYGISTPETAKFAGAMAMAARVYAPIDVKLAENYLNASQKAWEFLQKERSLKVDRFEGDDSGSGAYLNEFPEGTVPTDRNDRLWAAAELFITTGDSAFEQFLAQNIASWSYTLFEWSDPSPLGMVDYLMQTRRKGSDALKQQIKQKLIERADSLLQKVASSGYRLANQDFIWASNKRTAEEGMTLLYAYHLTGNKAYYNAAVDQLDYLLGRNHFNKSFITGVGTNTVRNVHHRIAQAKKIVIPGLMVGGPNARAEDTIAPKDRGPLSYLDDARSFATNEYAIDYNASAIGLMGMLMAQAD
jgi:endoglucanase